MADWLILEDMRFTNDGAFLREVLALLQDTDYKLQLVVRERYIERLNAELEGQRTLGRVKVKVRADGD
jgi:hypothetical protein